MSKEHEQLKSNSPDDPRQLIEQVMAMGDEFPGPAEDLLLSWILSLGPDTDAAAAARRLIETYRARLEGIRQDRPIARLWRLLGQAAEARPGRGQRRGGANARRS